MQFSDRILANQIKQFTEGLRSLESNLNGARADFVKFAAETKTRGTHSDLIIWSMDNQGSLTMADDPVHVFIALTHCFYFRQANYFRTRRACSKSRNQDCSIFITDQNLY